MEYCEKPIDQIEEGNMETLLATELQNFDKSSEATDKVCEHVICMLEHVRMNYFRPLVFATLAWASLKISKIVTPWLSLSTYQLAFRARVDYNTAQK